jgi:hypothetical protein
MEQSLPPCPVCKTSEHPKSTGKGYLCKPCANARSLNWAKKNKERHKGNQLKYRYGISKEEYDKKIAEQQNKCEICKEEETSTFRGTLKGLAVDHSHVSGKVRGLLCKNCNVSLGLLKENKQTIKAMLNYLEKYDES